MSLIERIELALRDEPPNDLLPGDLVSTALLFDPKPTCFVETITDVTYRTFSRADLKDLIFEVVRRRETSRSG